MNHKRRELDGENSLLELANLDSEFPMLKELVFPYDAVNKVLKL